jgi:hypothetical protein
MKRYIKSETLDKRPPKSEIDNYVKLDNGKYMLRDEWLVLRDEYNDVNSQMNTLGFSKSKTPKYKELAERRKELRETMGFVEKIKEPNTRRPPRYRPR